MGGIIWKISIVLLIQHSLFTGKSFAQEVAAAFRQFGLSPFIVPVPPMGQLSVVYPTGAVVQLGNMLAPSQTGEMPDIMVPPPPVRNDQFYTLIAFDADEISSDAPIFSNVVLWLVGNIPGQQVQSPQSDTIARYVGPAPLLATGTHRIVFLYYQQPSSLVFTELSLLDGTIVVRPFFSLTEFTTKYNLGDPIAGNFFLTQFDEGTVVNIVGAVV